MKEWNETATKLLDEAERFIKTVGYNAFSFKDLQKSVGVKTSSIHYYFSTKGDLAVAVFERFFARHKDSLAALDSNETSAEKRLRAVAQFFLANSGKGEFCLGGMMSSDIAALNEKTAQLVSGFFDHFEAWIESTIELGVKQGEFKLKSEAYSAKLFLATLEGGMLISRARSNSDYYEILLDDLIKQLQ